MALTCAVGKGRGFDAQKAGRQAAEACIRTLGQGKPDLLILFCSRSFHQFTVIASIFEVFPGVPLLGCSTAGEISSDGPDECSVVLGALAGVTVGLERGGDVGADSLEAGRELGRRLAVHPGELVMVFSDGLAGDGAGLVQGIQDSTGPVCLVGGAAGDDYRFAKTFQYFNQEVLSKTVVGARLQGDFRFGIGIRHGWEPVGLPVRVTQAEKNCLQSINGLPAMRLYDEYFGEYSARMRNEPLARLAVYYPLGQPVQGSDEFLLRAPLSVEAGGAIRFAAAIPEGSIVRLMIGSPERAIEAARVATQDALDQMEGRPPQIAIVFNCIARRRLFGPRAHEEIEAIQGILGPQVPLMGFYTYGEIAAIRGQKGQASCFHNETVVVMTLG